jgi:hypothetical protein
VPIGTPGISPKNLSLLNPSPFPVPNAEPSPVRQPRVCGVSSLLSDLQSRRGRDGKGRGAAISRSRATTTNPPGFKISALNRPAFVPRTTGRRQEITGTAGASNRQVRNQIRPSPQVARSASRTLSRWRHGFKSRWDYAVRGHIGASRERVAPHWPRGVQEAVTASVRWRPKSRSIRRDSRRSTRRQHARDRFRRVPSGAPRSRRGILRLFSGIDQFLTHELGVFDSDGQQVLMLERPAKLMKSKIKVSDAEGTGRGAILRGQRRWPEALRAGRSQGRPEAGAYDTVTRMSSRATGDCWTTSIWSCRPATRVGPEDDPRRRGVRCSGMG